MTILEIKNLEKFYGNFHALNDLSFIIPDKSIFGILGPNGSGKSTLMRILAGLIKSWRGQILFKNKKLNYKNSNILKNFGFMIESPSFYEYLTAFDNLKLFANITKTDQKKIHEVLELVKLNNRMNEKVKTFSYGMKQRLGIAQTLLHNPDILVLDEPNNGLDPSGINDMQKIINYLKDEGKTILISTHILSEAENLCTDIAILKRGKLIKSLNLIQAQQKNNKYIIKTPEIAKAKTILERHKSLTILKITNYSILITSNEILNLETIFTILKGSIVIESINKQSNLIEFFYD